MEQAAQKTNNVLSEGDKAPDFKAPTDSGGEISLSSFKGKKNIVLYFYPKDATPGCTVEANDFNNVLAEFTAADTEIIGISKDSVKSHDKFKEKQRLEFRLVSDENASICEDYGVWVEKNNYGKKYMGIQRATFLIDKKGIIQRIWPKVKVAGHVDEVLAAVQKL